eukprot:CAMPEP_0117054854 /NCGR_PEP_ID=MMETSP0472-20121206/38013_1 /TAXON_ID=693140 ORGANISM="Tiarina fusus, Strain LIS" /NCGR_SAMPLE_ID=MMETSP0472 /ASSEMBLY_ACC=CAM_ASM_000603 /LENGTH=147 /DNA_ID=CAMNT_0004770597 /DNA_START=109 /DNA_END=553 /DNA_ORIENTATION=+
MVVLGAEDACRLEAGFRRALFLSETKLLAPRKWELPLAGGVTGDGVLSAAVADLEEEEEDEDEDDEDLEDFDDFDNFELFLLFWHLPRFGLSLRVDVFSSATNKLILSVAEKSVSGNLEAFDAIKKYLKDMPSLPSGLLDVRQLLAM